MLRASVDRAVKVVVAEVPRLARFNELPTSPARDYPGSNVVAESLTPTLVVRAVASGGGRRSVAVVCSLMVGTSASPLHKHWASGFAADAHAHLGKKIPVTRRSKVEVCLRVRRRRVIGRSPWLRHLPARSETIRHPVRLGRI